MKLEFDNPQERFGRALRKVQGTRIEKLTRGAFLDLVEQGRAAGASGFMFSIGGRGTKIYPEQETYIHFSGRSAIPGGAVEIRGTDLHIGVDVSIENVIEKLATFAK